ncbi:MAG TPA: hypothetical protein VE442_19940 [Jatrophihabitans sp.]|jgi:hypothetical protein|nr:hypothetical protein [Jatrophihabitans sp.]
MRLLDVLGWAGSAVLVWSLLQARQLRLRAFNLIGGLVLIVYNWALGVWPQVGLNIVLAGINVWFLRDMLATRHDPRQYQVIQVGIDDDILDYVLHTHAEDIVRFNPGFDWSAGADRSAYLVFTGDNLVGVVLVRALDKTTAQVELDYVTKPYRDFTPGEFVYRSSHLFTDRGFRRVLTPPGEVDPYYGQLGFTKSGESYVLDLDG